ncbi:hypothetical protein LguiA_007684 [Lonicera macranthoides]
MAATAMALTFASLVSLRLLKRASCGTAFTSSESQNAGVTNTSSPTPSCLFSLSPFLSSPEQAFTYCFEGSRGGTFCFNPASIFYSSIYSEILYALLSIGGCHLMSGKSNYATLWLALSGSARSNGVLNAGYVCFQTMD